MCCTWWVPPREDAAAVGVTPLPHGVVHALLPCMSTARPLPPKNPETLSAQQAAWFGLM
jgi:hypothetical protein